MQCIEPSARLIHTLRDEVGGEGGTLVEQFLVLERIMNLGVWHSTGVEPDVDEVQFALQHGSTLAHQPDLIDVGAVQVDAVVVLLTHIAGHEASVLQRVGGHDASGHSFLYLVV